MPLNAIEPAFSTSSRPAAIPEPQGGAQLRDDDRLLDKVESVQQGIRRLLAAVEGRQTPAPAGWEFHEVRWRKDDRDQLFTEMAQGGWRPLASDAGLDIFNGNRSYGYANAPVLTFCRPLTAAEVAQRQQASMLAKKEQERAKAAATFDAKHTKSKITGWFRR